MNVSRRDFLKISGAATAGLMMGSLFDLAPIKAYAVKNPPQWDQVKTSICCYCAVGCGLLVGTSSTDSDAVYVQGDPDHPINRGSLCSKGQAMGHLHTVDGAVNPRRLLTPMKRSAYGTAWVPISWSQALNEITWLIKNTRDTYTVTEELIDGDLTPVNRCEAIASFGGAAHDNEECYLLVKLLRALGLVYIEHQARI
ncbi:MAG: twin-arginine translocation signal domain-containing protein [Desulfobacterales bacterium]|nr:MAG: twin-arginine translocation signal domain-containing protein [Desulfobacterales bacterium]